MTGPAYLRTREERERCRRHVGDPGDDSPRFFLHGLLAYKAPVGLLVESRAFLTLAGSYICVLRASHRPLFATGNRNSFSADRTSARGYLAPHRLTDMPCREMLCEILFAVLQTFPLIDAPPLGPLSPLYEQERERARVDECARPAPIDTSIVI